MGCSGYTSATFRADMEGRSLRWSDVPGDIMTTSMFKLPAVSIDTSELGEPRTSGLEGEGSALTVGVPISMSSVAAH